MFKWVQQAWAGNRKLVWHMHYILNSKAETNDNAVTMFFPHKREARLWFPFKQRLGHAYPMQWDEPGKEQAAQGSQH